jgi:hypothetical protein
MIAAANTELKLMIDEPEDDVFLEFAKVHYFNPSCSSESEFLEDLKRVKYIKRLLFRFHKAKTLKSIKERLILNHLTVLQNVFGVEASSRLLIMRHEPKFHSYLKSFFVYMKIDSKILTNLNFHQVNTDPRIDRKLSFLVNHD